MRFAPLALLLAACSCSGHQLRHHNPTAIDRMEDSTAVLVGREDGEVAGACAAVWVGEVDLLTAFHCVRDLGYPRGGAVGASVEFARRGELDGRDIEHLPAGDIAIVVAVREEQDLALMSARRRNHGVARLFLGDIYQGQFVWTVGHTFGLAYSVSRGVVGAAERSIEGQHVLQIVSGANHGDSGGGVWSEGGELMGIGSFRHRDSDLLFYEHRDEVRAFLEAECVPVE